MRQTEHHESVGSDTVVTDLGSRHRSTVLPIVEARVEKWLQQLLLMHRVPGTWIVPAYPGLHGAYITMHYGPASKQTEDSEHPPLSLAPRSWSQECIGRVLIRAGDE